LQAQALEEFLIQELDIGIGVVPGDFRHVAG
jgi:hypothetical protein